MKHNLIIEYEKSELRGELLAVRQIYGWGDYFKLKLFLKRIEGKVVNLVFTGADAFEEEDNNYWLPSSLWKAL